MILETATRTLLAPVRPRDEQARARVRRARRAHASTTPTSTSSTRAPRAGAWRRASSSRAASTSSRASACAPCRGEKTAFAYSDEISFDALAGRGARRRAPSRQPARRRRVKAQRRSKPPVPLYRDDRSGRFARFRAQGGAAREAGEKCRALDPRITQVMASLGGEYEVVLIARADGMLAADVRPLVRLSVQVIAESNGRRESRQLGRRRAHRLRAFHRRGARSLRASRRCRRRSSTSKRAPRPRAR